MSRSSTPPTEAANWAIAQLPGLTTSDLEKLHSLGIATTYQLLRQAQTPTQQRALAAKLQFHEHHIQKWVALANLARVPGVGCQFCGLLLHAGIASALQLAQASPNRLHQQMLRLHVATLTRNDLCPSVGDVSQWVTNARILVANRKP